MSIVKVNRAKLDKAIYLSDYNIKTICKKAGVSTQMLSYYRNGKYYPNVIIAVRLSKILNFKVEEVWNDEIGNGQKEL